MMYLLFTSSLKYKILVDIYDVRNRYIAYCTIVTIVCTKEYNTL